MIIVLLPCTSILTGETYPSICSFSVIIIFLAGCCHYPQRPRTKAAESEEADEEEEVCTSNDEIR